MLIGAALSRDCDRCQVMIFSAEKHPSGEQDTWRESEATAGAGRRTGCGARSVPAHLLPSSAISTTALPLRPASRRSWWLPATAAWAVRPSASAEGSRSCSGGRPTEPVSGCAANRPAAPETDARFRRYGRVAVRQHLGVGALVG